MNTETYWQARAAQAELARVQAQLPVTYYAAAPLADRVRNIVEHWRKLVPLAEELERVQAQAAAYRDAGEMLWTVVANVSGGDWKKQTKEWQEAAAKWRDNYFAAISDSNPTPRLIPAEKLAPIVEALTDLTLGVDMAVDERYKGPFPIPGCIPRMAKAHAALAAARALMEDAR